MINTPPQFPPFDATQPFGDTAPGAYQGCSTEGLAKEAPELIEEISTFHPIKAALQVATLQLEAKLLPANLRIDALVHLCVNYGAGERTPSPAKIGKWFKTLGETHAGFLEDPPEGLFSGLVRSSEGEFLTLDGIWESPTFYLQRFIDIIDDMPDNAQLLSIKQAAYALLRLSDAICRRAGIPRYELGGSDPIDELPKAILRRLPRRTKLLSFSQSDLSEVGVQRSQLDPFVALLEKLQSDVSAPWGGAMVDRYPLVLLDEKIVCLAPNSLSVAIRRFVIGQLHQLEFGTALQQALIGAYSKFISQLPISEIARRGPFPMQRTPFGAIGSVGTKIDQARYFQVVAIVDDFTDFAEGELGGEAPDKGSLIATLLKQHIENFADAARQQTSGAKGIVLVIGCGYGRLVRYGVPTLDLDGWRIEFITAPDAETFAWTDDLDARSLWRLWELEARHDAADVHFINANGLLNLIAWNRANDGHLIPHGDIPDHFRFGEQPLVLQLPLDLLRDLRQTAIQQFDPRALPRFDGVIAKVRHIDENYFSDPRRNRLYMDEENRPDLPLRSVFEGQKWLWWVSVSPDSNREAVYRHWEMLNIWLVRIAEALDPVTAGAALTHLHLRFQFTALLEFGEATERPDALHTDPATDIKFDVDFPKSAIRFTVGRSFEENISNPENVSERALVAKIVEAVLSLSRVDLSEAESKTLLDKIVPGPRARQLHGFAVREFRQQVALPVPERLITVNEMDDALFKLGLGWQHRTPSEGSEITGVQNCTEYLRKTVRSVEQSLQELARTFSREALVEIALGNHEKAAVDQARWRATAASIFALHDKAVVYERFFDQASKHNNAKVASRLLVELALSESPETGGSIPGEIEIGRMLTMLSWVFQIGGASDAIYWGVMEPKIRITPLGDIHMNFGSFYDSILEPYTKDGQRLMIDDDVQNQKKNYEELEPSPAEAKIDPAFQTAWRQEMTLSFEAYREFLDAVEDWGIDHGQGVIRVARSRFVRDVAAHCTLSKDEVGVILAELSNAPRTGWFDVPEGYSDKDRQPWRYRRRLSLVNKPIAQLTTEPDPTLFVTPGLVRDGFAAFVHAVHQGHFPQASFKSKAMRSWAGRQGDERGAEFARRVRDRLTELGWQTKLERELPEILGTSLPEDYGDVDVIAYNIESGRVFLLECKDLAHQKTPGEVAEQLSKFRGELTDKGKKDLLMKHLVRVKKLRENPDRLKRYLELNAPPEVHDALVFRHPVPMKYAVDSMAKETIVMLYDELENLSDVSVAP